MSFRVSISRPRLRIFVSDKGLTPLASFALAQGGLTIFSGGIYVRLVREQRFHSLKPAAPGRMLQRGKIEAATSCVDVRPAPYEQIYICFRIAADCREK